MSKHKYWCGFTDGNPHVEEVIDDYGECEQIAVFVSRTQARKRFEDVREVVLPAGKPASHSEGSK